MIFVKRKYIFSVLFCFLGGELPDLIDKAFFPLIGLRHLEVFHWNWDTTINFFYQSINIVFKMVNSLVIVVSLLLLLLLLLLNVKFIVHHMLKHTKTDDKKH